MQNNFYEEKYMKDEVINSHRKAIDELGLPGWLKEIDCPHCSARINPEGIRNLSLCLNSRNIGDICVEYHCRDCGIMDSVYYRSAVNSRITEFSSYINGYKKPESKPVVEEEMYKLRYNNLIENYIK
jgi:hypothetical protein